jgi:hypothetical protein
MHNKIKYFEKVSLDLNQSKSKNTSLQINLWDNKGTIKNGNNNFWELIRFFFRFRFLFLLLETVSLPVHN